MNLEQAVQMERMQTPEKAEPVPRRLTALEMAERVFELAAQAGSPYEHITPRQWVKKWLASPEFVLMQVETDKVALLRTPRNQNQVIRNMQAQVEGMEPLVVDLNKQGLQAPGTGYQPSAIAVDGAHRAYGKYLQGVDTVLAWVGTKAVARVRPQPLIQASAQHRVYGKPVYKKDSKIASAALLHAAQGMANPMRQDTGDGGPAPTGGLATAMKSGAPSGSDYIKDRGVRAGGPGSGRHAGTGRDTRQFEPDHKEYRAYEHFDYNNKNASFTCKDKSCRENSFANVRDMYQHLKDKHPATIDAGGPGSGRRPGGGVDTSWVRHSTVGRYDIHEGRGTKAGQWMARERGRGVSNRESKVFNSLTEARDHAENSGMYAFGGGAATGATGGPGGATSGPTPPMNLKSYGTSEGSTKGWETRGRGNPKNPFLKSLGMLSKAKAMADRLGEKGLSQHLDRMGRSIHEGHGAPAHHMERLQNYATKMNEKANDISDKVDVRYSPKLENQAARYGNLGDHLGETYDHIDEHVRRGMDAARRTPEARSTGKLQPADPSDTKVPPDPSDTKQVDDPSDRLQYEQQPQEKPPGVRTGRDEQRGFKNPVSDAPGAGVGPRLDPDKGATQSEMQRKLEAKGKCSACGDDMEAGPIKVKKMVTKKKKRK